MTSVVDGLTRACADFELDGTHPSARGVQKVSDILLHFFPTNLTARTWFDG